MPGKDSFQHGGAFPMGIIPMGNDPRRSNGFDASHLSGEQQTHRRGPVGHAELADRLLDMAVHRLRRDLELSTDVLGGPVPRSKIEALTLARRQAVKGKRRYGKGH